MACETWACSSPRWRSHRLHSVASMPTRACMQWRPHTSTTSRAIIPSSTEQADGAARGARVSRPQGHQRRARQRAAIRAHDGRCRWQHRQSARHRAPRPHRGRITRLTHQRPPGNLKASKLLRNLDSRARGMSAATDAARDQVQDKKLGRAELWRHQLASGEVGSRAELARREGVSRAYVTQLLGRRAAAPEPGSPRHRTARDVRSRHPS